ncbi:hypothetical protein ER308_17915 [Egibacter rhizosphaerae]|uniref:Chemotaxis protein CheX n=1 Tax=Egibacter rhizosphaerae TaxID=1670831 RepID=A0A411YJD3_9ACTN|nr:hypothetical protein [Egibacter rhizosphaerae]QBI21261.1 hypothetical protein ER308_17915 [Egibacter rhizosphaerae]
MAMLAQRGTTVPLPPRASVRDLLGDLLGQPVRVDEGAAFELSEVPSLLAAYRFDQGGAAAVAVASLPFAAGAGAAIGMVPVAEAREAARIASAAELDEELHEFFHEVVNVLAKLLNSPSTPHVVLRELLPVPGEVPGDIAQVVLHPAGRVDYRVTVGDYGTGALTLVAR